jgi:hypothetical protein
MADTLQPTNRYVHFPAELIPSDHLAYISLSRTDTEIPQLALAYETLRDEDKRREYDLIHPLIRQTPDPPTTQRLRRSLAPPALQQPRAVSRSYNMSPEAHRNLQNAGVVSMQARDAARKMEGPKSQSNAPEDSGRQEKRLVSPAMEVPARPAHQSATTKANGARSTAAHCVHNVSMSACTSSCARSVVPTQGRFPSGICKGPPLSADRIERVVARIGDRTSSVLSPHSQVSDRSAIGLLSSPAGSLICDSCAASPHLHPQAFHHHDFLSPSRDPSRL